MPNHVYNTLYGTGKPHTMEKLHEASKDLGGGIAQILMPRPADQEDNWYSWNIDNWGTKWGCYEQDIEGDLMHFTTAWGRISHELLDRIAIHFPTFVFEYEEETGWGGIIRYKNGIQDFIDTYEDPEWGAMGYTQKGEGVLMSDFSTVYRLDEDYIKLGEVYKKGWYHDRDLAEPVDSSEQIRITEEY